MPVIGTTLSITAAVLLFAQPARGNPASHFLETAMSEPTSTDPAPLRNVTLTVDNQPVVITPADAEEIARALQRYLDANKVTDEGVPLPSQAGQPWVDSRGTLRIGSWMLGSRGDRLVLTLREAAQPGTKSGYQFIGALARTKSGWQVPSVGVSKIQYR